MFPNEGGQKHLVRNTKGQWGSKEKDGYILLEQSNCALVGQVKRLDSIKNARYNCEN